MHYRTLGRTGLRVSLLGFGSGGPSNLGQRKGLTQRQQDALIRRCFDLGINLFDTADAYGDSEAILGRALEGIARDSYFLVTKWRHDNNGGEQRDPLELATSVEKSLRLLGTDYIDVMQFHGLTPSRYSTVVERYYPVIKRLQEQGKIRFTGLSVWFSADPEQEVAVLALKSNPGLWDTVMLKYGILNQHAVREALPLALEHGVGVLNMAPVRIKLPHPDLLEQQIAAWKERGYLPKDSLPDSDPLGWLVHDDVDSVISAGYKFAADHPAIATVLSGTSSIEHLERNVAALEKPYLAEPDTSRLVSLFGEIAEYA